MKKFHEHKILSSKILKKITNIFTKHLDSNSIACYIPEEYIKIHSIQAPSIKRTKQYNTSIMQHNSNNTVTN